MEDALKILVVDDDAIDRMAVVRALHRAGVQVRSLVEAETGAAAIAILEQEEFDCAFIGYCLPDGDGLDLVKQIRDRQFRGAVIALTGQGDERLAVKLIKAGANDYLLKSQLASEDVSRFVWQAVRIQRAELLAQEATQRLRESEERYRLVLEGANDGIWDWYICENKVYCNDRMYEILGLSAAEIGTAQAAFVALIHPDDQGRVLDAMRSHLQAGTPFDVEFRLRHASGEYRYCTSRGKAQRNRSGSLFRMSGIVSDITQRKQDEQKIVQLNRDLENRVIELQTLLDVIPIGIGIAHDAACEDIRGNASLSQQFNMAPNENVSKSHPNGDRLPYKIYQNGRELLPHELPMQRSTATGIEVSGEEIDVVHDTGKVVKLLAEVAPLFDQQSQPRGCIGAFLDITDRKRTEDAQRFLANASALLATSLDAETILESLAHLTVPYLSDWCLIHTLQDGQLQCVAVQHADAEKLVQFQRIRDRYPLKPDAIEGIPVVARTGQSKFYPNLAESGLEQFAEDARHLDWLRSVGFRSAMIVPLLARERILGTITLASAESGRFYTPSDLELAEDLARRAGLAIDNARLYQATQQAEQNLRKAFLILNEQQQQLHTLQRLTDLLNQRLTDLPGLLQVMIDAVREAMPTASFGVIMLHDRATDSLTMTATTGLDLVDAQRASQTVSALETKLKEVFETGAACLSNEPSDSLPASICAVPINASCNEGSEAADTRRGVLAIGNWSDSNAFDADDMQLLMAFSEQAAIALNNAQLINALEAREEQLADQNATLIQQNQELENQRQQIQLQNLKLIEASQLKSQFVATMSHELRTPMNAIMGFSQLLLRQKTLTPQQTEIVSRILNNSKNLLALINDILDLSKIEAGRLELKREKFSLPNLVLATIDELRSLADQKNLVLHSEIDVPNSWIVNDRSRLRQILVNLLSNAIKFTDVGRVDVYVSDVSSERIAIMVKDTGIGIAPHHLKRIFEEFRQLDQTITRRHPGTGLGLSITKLLVQLMNGTITVESSVGQGSTFRVELPRELG